MEKGNQFYDPYNFNSTQGFAQQSPMYDSMDMMMPPPAPSQASQYEQQYMYYRYLSQMMDYKIKSREFENLCRDDKK